MSDHHHGGGNDPKPHDICQVLGAFDGLLRTLLRIEHALMSKISEFASAQAAFNDRMDAAISGLAGDVANLTAQIAALQATQGAITPEDQALLDGIQARAATITAQLEALDGLTPPAPPAG